MSTFIANTVAFAPDFLTYKLKGGDNNVFPRPDNWTRDIPMSELLRDIAGGMVRLTGTPKNKKILGLVNKYMAKFETDRTNWGWKDGDGNPDSIWDFGWMADKLNDFQKKYYAEMVSAFTAEIIHNFNATTRVDHISKDNGNTSQVRLF